MKGRKARGRLRSYIGAIWTEGESGWAVLTAGPGEPDRGRVVDLVECRIGELPDALEAAERAAAAEGGAVDWTAPLRGSAVITEACLVPREVASAPAETKAIACLAGTAWGDPDASAQMRLRLGYQIDGDRCAISAVHDEALADARASYANRDVRLIPEAVALAELVRAAHPEAADEGVAVLAILCSGTFASLVVLEAGTPAVYRQCDLADAIRAQSAGRHAADAAAYEPTAASWSADEFVPTWKTAPVEVDRASWQAAILGEVRDTLAIYAEGGGHVGDVSATLVTGAAAEHFELRSLLPSALGFDVDVIELEASRVVVSSDVDVARRVAEAEATLAGAFALLAAARRSDAVSFRIGEEANAEHAHVRVDRARSAHRVRAALPYVLAAAIAMVSVAGYLALRYRSTAHARDDAAARLAAEQRRAVELRAISEEKAANESKHRHALELLAAVDSIRTRQRAPADLLTDVRGLLPQRAGLERLAYDGAWITIVGASESASDADTFALSLQSASDRFADVSPATTADSYVHEPAQQTGLGPETRPLERFTIRARYLLGAPVAGAAGGSRRAP